MLTRYNEMKLLYASIGAGLKHLQDPEKIDLKTALNHLAEELPEHLQLDLETLSESIENLEDSSESPEKTKKIKILLSLVTNPIILQRGIPKNPYALAQYLYHYILNDDTTGGESVKRILNILLNAIVSNEADSLLETITCEEDLPELEFITEKEFKEILGNLSEKGTQSFIFNYDELLKYKNINEVVEDRVERFNIALNLQTYIKVENSYVI